MCDPVTALLVAGAGLEAFSQVTQGIAAKRAGKFQQQIERQNAAFELEKAHADELRSRRNSERVLSLQIATMAKSGFDITLGSPLLLFHDSVKEAELDALNIRASGQVRARDAKLRGTKARFEGDNAFFQGVLGAGASLIKGASNIGQVGGFGGSTASSGGGE